MDMTIFKITDEAWNPRTSSGENPHISKDDFGSSLRQGNTQHDRNMIAIRAQREKEQRDKITAAARSTSWDNAQKNKDKKGIFESLNKIFKK